MAFAEQLDQWREFYLALAGAAAVLLGLVYVALALHLERAEEPTFRYSASAPRRCSTMATPCCCRWPC